MMHISIDQKRQEAARLAEEGKSYRQIAKELGVAPMTVYYWLPSKEEQGMFREMAELRLKGLTNIEIAEKLGVDRKKVSSVLGPLPRLHRAQSDRRQIRMEPGTYDRLKQVAQGLGLHVGKGSVPRDGAVGRMLDAIARGELNVSWKNGYGPHIDTVED